MGIDQVTTDDYPAILDANEAAVPEVNSISLATLADLARQACYFRVARDGNRIAGFLLALQEGASYGSPNFRWFALHYPRFIYVDRVVVVPAYRRSRIGRELYADLESMASAAAPILTCEVNLDPPNPGSLAFHEDLGFAEVGRQHTDDGKKYVCLMRKELSR